MSNDRASCAKRAHDSDKTPTCTETAQFGRFYESVALLTKKVVSVAFGICALVGASARM
jgi:hypothetical protein